MGLLSTVGAYVGNKTVSTGFHVTSPQPSDLQKFMDQMVKKNYEYLVLEVTSHGNYQFRTWGIKPIISGLTNVSNEHLDYHLTDLGKVLIDLLVGQFLLHLPPRTFLSIPETYQHRFFQQ